jgi:glycosyltransferase involved in cell wall biosynthesis
LIQLQHSSHILVGYQRREKRPEIDVLPVRKTFWQKALFRLVNRFEECTGLQYLVQPWKNQFLRHPFTQQADVINLHNIHSGFFSYTILPKLSAMAPLVWTLHDLWSLTGHCTYPGLYGCERWKTGCGRCPVLSDYPAIARDTTAFLWRTKNRVYRRSDITLVTPSRWMAEVVRQSPLLSQCAIHYVPHGLDTDVFKPTPKMVARKTLDVPADAKIVLFSSFDLFLPRKGGTYLLEALQRLVSKGAKDLLLLIVGDKQSELGGHYQFPVRGLGPIDDERVMALCYSAADVYVGPSLVEAFGLVFSEAMACATPVVAFASTGAAEVVRHMETGYLARYKDVEDLAQGIRLLLEDDGLREKFKRRSREVVEQEYTLALQAQRHVELYRHVIERRSAGQRTGVSDEF